MDAKTKSIGRADLQGYVDARKEDGVSRIDRSVFLDEGLFAMEMEKIWEGTWLFLAHESQIQNPNDFLTMYMGRQPIILARNEKGDINAFINACSHRGSSLVRVRKGNRPDYTCGFHSWCYNSSGELISVHKESVGGYPESFCKENYNLIKVPKLENYRGFIFASLNAEAPSLKEHLGDAAIGIDLFADQAGEEGLEVLEGYSTYTYDGNWKMQGENGSDGYHVEGTHGNWIATVMHRQKMLGDRDKIKSMQINGVHKQKSGFLDMGNGHTMLWGDIPNASSRPNWSQREKLIAKHGENRVRWMLDRFRNLYIYPNVFFMDQASTQLRLFRPLSVNKTEVTIFAIARKTDTAEERNLRIRQYEDFFNVSGMATSDDIMEFNQSQVGFNGRLARWSDLSRGLGHEIAGGTEETRELGIQPRITGADMADESIFLAQHKNWLRLMSQ